MASLLDLGNKLKNLFSQGIGSVANTLQQPVPSQIPKGKPLINTPLSKAKSLNYSNIPQSVLKYAPNLLNLPANPLSPAGQRYPDIPKVNLPKINTGAVGTQLIYDNLVKPLTENVINTPHDLIQAHNQTTKDFQTGEIKKPKVAVSDVAKAAIPAINIFSFGGGSIGKNIFSNTAKNAVVKNTWKGAGKEMLKGVARGAVEGGSFTGVMASLSSLADGRDKNFKQQVLDSIVAGGKGTIAGIALGGTIGGIGNVVGQIKSRIIQSRVVKGEPLEIATQKADIYLRDRMSKFLGLKKNQPFKAAGGKLVNPKDSPIIHDWKNEIDNELGVNLEEFNKGSIKLNAKIGVKSEKKGQIVFQNKPQFDQQNQVDSNISTEGIIPQDQKLLTGSTQPLTPQQAKKIFKKTGTAYPFENTQPNGEPIMSPPPGSKVYKEGKPVSEQQAISDWEKQIQSETVTQKQYNATQERAFKATDKQVQDAMGGTRAYKGGKNPELTGNFPARSLSTKQVNDKASFFYQRETLLRNIEDTFKNPQDKQAVKQYFHDPIVANETANTQFKNQLRTKLSKTFKDLGVNRGSKEDYAAADFIEGTISKQDLVKKFGADKANNIINAAEQGRATYKDLLGRINAELAKFGYSPIPERQNYVTHTAQIQTLMDRFGNMLNFSKEKLPTEMSAINVNTKPGKEFFRFGLKRSGGSTHEGLISSLDKYIDPAGNQIFHTADIQRGRALLDFLNKSNTGTQNTTLSNFNSYLGQYVDSLAGKKNIIDRPFEKVLGMGVLKAGNWLRKRTGANMVGGNISSAITNFIPFTQSMATTSKPSVLKGLFESVLSPARGISNIDGVQSGFLTRRFPEEQIGSTLGSSAKNAAGFLFKTIDAFTSKSIVAGKYFEGLSKGLSKDQAMAQADEYGARVLADRSAGQMPLLFNSKVLGALTQFQLEVNNQVSFLLKDIPKNSGYSKAQVTSSLAQFVIYSYVFNNLFQQVTGRRPQIDVLDAALKTYSNISQGKPLKDTLDPTNQNTPVGGLVQNLPFASTFTGGRIPIGSALPDVAGLMNETTSLSKEATKPLFYIAPPLGGGQIKKTIEGVTAYNQGASTTSKGQVRFPIQQNTPNLLRTSLFGQYSTPEATNYFNTNQRPLSEKQSSFYKMMPQDQKQSFYNQTLSTRQQEQLINSVKDSLGKGGNVDKKAKQTSYNLNGTDIQGYQVGDRFIYTDENGDVKTKSIKDIKISQLKEEAGLIDAQYSLSSDRLKRVNDYTTWSKTTKTYINYLKKYQNKLDKKKNGEEIIRIQNKIEDLQDKLNKYGAYGGFKKGKKIRLALPSTKVPTLQLSKVNSANKVRNLSFKTPSPPRIKISFAKKGNGKFSLRPYTNTILTKSQKRSIV